LRVSRSICRGVAVWGGRICSRGGRPPSRPSTASRDEEGWQVLVAATTATASQTPGPRGRRLRRASRRRASSAASCSFGWRARGSQDLRIRACTAGRYSTAGRPTRRRLCAATTTSRARPSTTPPRRGPTPVAAGGCRAAHGPPVDRAASAAHDCGDADLRVRVRLLRGRPGGMAAPVRPASGAVREGPPGNAATHPERAQRGRGCRRRRGGDVPAFRSAELRRVRTGRHRLLLIPRPRSARRGPGPGSASGSG
jgi:hypothetical protein